MSNQINSKLISNKKSNFATDFLLAGISAAIGKTAGAPLERVKLILQTQQNLDILGGSYKGPIDCFYRLLKTEGFFSLWRGNVINVMRYFPNQALNFALKDTFKEYLCNFDRKIHYWKYALGSCLSGGLAGSISLILLHPIDLARTRLATDNIDAEGKRKFSGTIDCLGKILKSEGVIGLYRGILVSTVSIFIYRAAYFGGYDTMKNELKTDSLLIKWMMTQILLILAGIFYYPLDTIRRRIMVECGKQIDDKKYKNAIDCLIKTFQIEKISGFYKGFLTNAVRNAGSSVILIMYDELQKLLGLEARGVSK